MPPGTLRVPLSTQGSSLAQGDAERHGMHSHAEHGNDQVSRDGFWRTNQASTRTTEKAIMTKGNPFRFTGVELAGVDCVYIRFLGDG